MAFGNAIRRGKRAAESPRARRGLPDCVPPRGSLRSAENASSTKPVIRPSRSWRWIGHSSPSDPTLPELHDGNHPFEASEGLGRWTR